MIEENSSFFRYPNVILLESAYIRFVFIYFLEYRIYHSPNICLAIYQQCFIPWQQPISFSRVQFQKSIFLYPHHYFLSSSYILITPRRLICSISTRIVTAPSITPHFPRLMVRLKRSGGHDSRNLTFQSINAIVS